MAMRLATAHLKSTSPYGQSKGKFDAEGGATEKKSRDETHEEHERRTWKQRCHVGEDGIIFIPPMAFKNCLSAAAKYKGIKIPGEGSSRYTKHVEAGILVVDPIPIGVHIDDVVGTWLFVPSDGKRGGSKRVWKCFPTFQSWESEVKFYIMDDIIPEDIFEQFLTDAGLFIGVGFFRPSCNGYWGRFEVNGVEYSAG